MSQAQFGMIGLGTMGRNFLLNVADSGFSSVGYDIDPAQRELLVEEGRQWGVEAASSPEDLIARLVAPRSIMLLVPAGPVVDIVIGDLLPHLEPGDLIIDGGNSHYPDTARREKMLEENEVGFLGVGVSGGEEGARLGPSIMPGGKRDYYDRIAPIFEAVAAKVEGEACVAYMGAGAAGHFVKMVHNGIEYAMMQILAEAYDLMHRVLRMNHRAMAAGFSEWNFGRLNSYLVEITADILSRDDAETGRPLVEMILDTAGQKGTGVWTSQAALELGIAVPTIDAAVSMRQISALKPLRRSVAENFDLGDPMRLDDAGRTDMLRALEAAIYGGFISSYVQGFSLLHAASEEYDYALDPAEIAKIWRGGCIIRSRFLSAIKEAYLRSPGLPSLLLDEEIAGELDEVIEDMRHISSIFAENPTPGMAFATALFYLEAFASDRLPANLTQAQRDYFGAHSFQRIDREGTFHIDSA